MSDPSGESGRASSEPLIFVSDASAEAQRLTGALRSRGYEVVDVPLGLLVGRVAAQRPSLILCDVDAVGALETTHRLRDVPGAAGVDIIFLGEPGRTLADMADAVFHEGSGVFARPVDVYALLRKIEALIGAPTRPASGSIAPPSHRGAVRRQSSPFASRFPPPLGPTGDGDRPSPSPSPSQRVSSRPPSTGSRPPSAPPRAGSTPPSLPAPIPLGFGADRDALTPMARHIPQSEMSPELERLLARAEQRLSVGATASAPPSHRLSPDAEVEAVLPADVLAALDEPLDAEDEDDEGGSSAAPGTRNGSEVGRSAAGTVGATTGMSAALGTASRSLSAEKPASAAASDPMPAQLELTTPPPPHTRQSSKPDAADVDASATPPAIGRRPSSRPAPASRGPRTSVEPVSAEPLLVPEATHRPEQLALTEPPMRRRASSDPGERDGWQSSTTPPQGFRAVTKAALGSESAAGVPEIPAALGRGDAVRALARAIRMRYAGALAFEDAAGIRRVVFRDGDFVTAASGIEGESLVAFMTQRGDLNADAASRLVRKLPQFGRHAGAALIAHGHLRQDELWTALRAHAEWLIGRIVEISRGAASLEHELPGRLQEEPAVFGGATGAEVLVEIVRRTVGADEAIARLGGTSTNLRAGPATSLLAECALADDEVAIIKRATNMSLEEVIEATGASDFAAVIYALRELGVLESAEASSARMLPARNKPAPDELDEEALRTRIQNRKSLVDEGDYFAVLGVSRTATSYDIRRAYLQLRREFEPSRVLTGRTADLSDDVDVILEVIKEAYEILRDQLRRERYRRALEARPR